MRMALPALICATLLSTGPAWAGSAEVVYEHPERYTDIGPQRDAESVQKILTSQLQELAATRLPAGQTLQLVITDIDLAGEIPPASRHLHDVRVMGRLPDWPRITLRFSLQEGGRALAEGSETVSDMAYLMRSTSAGGSGALPYEQRMLSDWFDHRFGKLVRR